MDIEHSITVRTPLNEVFKYLSNLQNRKEYLLETVETTPLNDVPTTEGTLYIEKSKFLGMNWKHNFQITSFIQNHRIVARSFFSKLPIEQDFRLKAVEGGTQINWRVKIMPKGAYKMLSPVIKSKMRQQMVKNINQLKETLDFKLSNHFFLNYTNMNANNWL